MADYRPVLNEILSLGAELSRITARKRIPRDVEGAIDVACDDRVRPLAEAEKAELRVDLLERLDAPDTEEDIAGRPIEDIVSDICRDLGVRLEDASHRGPANIETLRARAARPPDAGPPRRHRNDKTPELPSLK